MLPLLKLLQGALINERSVGEAFSLDSLASLYVFLAARKPLPQDFTT
jgi:hypothetical protein